MSHDPTGKAAAYPIVNKADFKAWVLQHPNPYKLLKEIIFRWRGSTIQARGARGVWAVYPLDRWAEWAGLSRHQIKRALRILDIDGLVAREYHKFAGPGVWLHLQPTKLALKYMGRPQDLERIGDHLGPVDAPDDAPDNAPKVAPDCAPDHTLPFPSSPTFPSSPMTLQAFPHTSGKGKGKAGEDGKVKKVLKIVSSSQKPALTPQSPSPPKGDDEDAAFVAAITAMKAKQLEKSQKTFPSLKGKHEKYVKHPSEMYPGWASWSLAKKIEKQAQYETFVDNWYKGKQGKPYAPVSEWTDEDDVAWQETVKSWNLDDEDDYWDKQVAHGGKKQPPTK